MNSRTKFRLHRRRVMLTVQSRGCILVLEADLARSTRIRACAASRSRQSSSRPRKNQQKMPFIHSEKCRKRRNGKCVLRRILKYIALIKGFKSLLPQWRHWIIDHQFNKKSCVLINYRVSML